MKGLIIKDLLNLKKYLLTILLIIIFLIAFMSFSFEDSSITVSIIIIIINSMMTITTFSFDEITKWDMYAMSFPISRKNLVLSKYILALILGIIGFIMSLFISILIDSFKNNIDILELLTINFISMAASLILISIILPIVFKFGAEKSRFASIPIFAIPGIIQVLLIENIKSSAQFLYTYKNFIPFIFVIILIFVMLLSFSLSLKIYRKKEL